MSKSNGIRIYISRDARPFSNVELWTRKPKWTEHYDGEGMWEDNTDAAGPVQQFCTQEFKRVTGVKLKRGQIRHVRISVEDAK